MANWVTLKNGVHIDLDDPNNPITGSGSFADFGSSKQSSQIKLGMSIHDWSKREYYQITGITNINGKQYVSMVGYNNHYRNVSMDYLQEEIKSGAIELPDQETNVKTVFKPLNKQMEKEREVKANYFRNLGAKVSDDGMVTLYHATAEGNIKSINENGFKGSNAPVNGGVIESIRPRSFFGYDKNWVEDTWSGKGNLKVMEVKIPAEYLHQAGQNKQEVYVEGNIKNKNGVWIPDIEPTSTAWDRITIKRYERQKQK